MAKDSKFDDIFEETGKGGASPKKAAKKAPAKKAAAKTPAAGKSASSDVTGSDFEALNAALLAHHEEAMQCKAREDRYFVWSTALIVSVVLAAFLAFTGQHDTSWFGRVLIKLLLIGAAGASAFFAMEFIESNRRKMRDLMGVVVKINERLGFFEPGRFDGSDEPFYPHTYKFAGADSEDESSQKVLFLKGAAVFAAVVILFFV